MFNSALSSPFYSYISLRNSCLYWVNNRILFIKTKVKENATTNPTKRKQKLHSATFLTVQLHFRLDSQNILPVMLTKYALLYINRKSYVNSCWSGFIGNADLAIQSSTFTHYLSMPSKQEQCQQNTVSHKPKTFGGKPDNTCVGNGGN